MKTWFYIFTLTCFNMVSCTNSKAQHKDIEESSALRPIPIQIETLSGIDLKPVKNQNDPDRRLFQKRLLRGEDISVYVVSSETATAQQENYGMEEFIYLLNGRSRMNPVNGEEVIYNTGDFFVAPKGFTGEWETQGGDEFLIELSVISTQRSNEVIDSKPLPYLLDKAKLSGIGITPIASDNNTSYKDNLFNGPELDVTLHAHSVGITIDDKGPMKEQLIYIISGAVTIQDKAGEEFTFHRGDFYVLPKGFEGTMTTKGHGLFRYMSVSKSDRMK